jgi:outer membrane receptor protein involved in Fe transport
MTSDSFAVFGDVIWHVTDRLNLTGGLRYTDDSKGFRWFNRPRTADELDQQIFELAAMGLLGAIPPELLFVLNNNIVFANAVGVPVERSGGWDDLSPRLVADYQFSNDTMGFVSVSKGYKAGGNDGAILSARHRAVSPPDSIACACATTLNGWTPPARAGTSRRGAICSDAVAAAICCSTCPVSRASTPN